MALALPERLRKAIYDQLSGGRRWASPLDLAVAFDPRIKRTPALELINAALVQAYDTPDARRFFINGNGDRMLFDLPSYGLWRLRQAGVGHAEWTRHCTYRDPARFYSYRRTTHAGEADYGRLISVIRL